MYLSSMLYNSHYISHYVTWKDKKEIIFQQNNQIINSHTKELPKEIITMRGQ